MNFPRIRKDFSQLHPIISKDNMPNHMTEESEAEKKIYEDPRKVTVGMPPLRNRL